MIANVNGRTTGPPTLTDAPERLTPDEYAYHDVVLQEFKAARGAWMSWQRHLAAKYRLQAGDGIAEDGSITRGNR